MKIIDTFVPGLFSFKYENEEKDEFFRHLDQWNDIIFLADFFEKNQNDLKYFNLDISNSINKTIYENEELQDILINISDNRDFFLDQFFENLHNEEYKTIVLSKQKAKQYWLRLYALKIDTNIYVITGGAIKLTRSMQGRSHTERELQKLEECKQFLRKNDVFDYESFKEFKIDE